MADQAENPILVWERNVRMRSVEKIKLHSLFNDQKGMVQQALREDSNGLNDTDISIILYLYITGSRLFENTNIFSKRHIDLKSKCIHEVIQKGKDFEKKFNNSLLEINKCLK